MECEAENKSTLKKWKKLKKTQLYKHHEALIAVESATFFQVSGYFWPDFSCHVMLLYT